MTDANFRAMLCATNDSATYFDTIKRAIALEVAGDDRAAIAWESAAKRGARLELQAGGCLDGFDAAVCGKLIRGEYEEEIAESAA
jgi:hypothetical protein